MTDWRILINFHIKCLVLVESESKASTGYITAAETETQYSQGSLQVELPHLQQVHY